MSAAPPPPGWYPDPDRPGSWRWWDGRTWSTYRHDAAAASVARSRGLETASAPFAEVAVLVYELIAAVGVVIAWANQRVERRFWHGVREVVHLVATSGSASAPKLPVLPAPVASTAWQLVSSLAALAAGVAFLVWQYRAARLAAEVGYPARRTPGWGVGVWFIPIVSWWMPLQALQDLFPPGHHLRRSAGWTWVAFKISLYAQVGALAICEISSPLDPFLYLAVIALNLGLGGFGLTLIRAVDALHRDAATRFAPAS